MYQEIADRAQLQNSLKIDRTMPTALQMYSGHRQSKVLKCHREGACSIIIS